LLALVSSCLKRAKFSLEEIDVFELARLRGTTVSGLRELMTDRNARADEQRERLLTTG
jgi:hypothetical protein